jgi:hypothetical protein
MANGRPRYKNPKLDGSSTQMVPTGPPDARKYLSLIRTGYRHKQACELSGYSPLTKTKDIQKAAYAMIAALSLEEQRARLRDMPGLAFADCVQVARITRDKKNQNPDVILKANRQVIEVMGYEAPKEINITEQRNVAIAIGILHDVASHQLHSPSVNTDPYTNQLVTDYGQGIDDPLPANSIDRAAP